jgi:N utilization substance protein B
MISDKVTRQERLSKALRANLIKRKQQQRQRENLSVTAPYCGEKTVKEKNGSARHMSRMGAIQALYQSEQMAQDMNAVLQDFTTHHFAENNGIFKTQPDVVFFRTIAEGVQKNMDAIDPIIQGCLQENWRMDRLPSVMRSLLRAGAYELMYEPLVPTPVVLNEYIEIGKDFFQERDVSFVNGILDAVAKKVRH